MSIVLLDKKLKVTDRTRPLAYIDNPYFTYIASLYSKEFVQPLVSEVAHLTHTYGGVFRGKSFVANRTSCLFIDETLGPPSIKTNHFSDKPFSYKELNSYSFTQSPTLMEVKAIAEQTSGLKFNSCLVNYYPNGLSDLGWHRDRESQRSSVFSVSFGATRLFRMRKFEDTSGWDYEFSLESGDVVWMHGPRGNNVGCQQKYKHSVPVQKKVTLPRLNLTFRQFEGAEID